MVAYLVEKGTRQKEKVIPMNKESYPYLIISTPKGNRKFLLSSGNSWTIGRDSSNQFIIKERWISRNHAIIQKTNDNSFCLTDLSSSNGSYVNGKRVNGSTILENKAKIFFGKTKVQFHYPLNVVNTQIHHNVDHETLTSMFHKRSVLSAIIVELYDQDLLANELDDNILSMIIDDWFSQTKLIFYQRGIVVNKSVGNSLIGIKFHQYKEPERSELFDLFQAVVAIDNMTSNLMDKYFLTFPLKIGITLNTGDAMVKTNKTNQKIDYDIFGNVIDISFYLKSALLIIDKNFILGQKTYSCCNQLSLLKDLFEVINNPLQYINKNPFLYTTDFHKLAQVFQPNTSLKSSLELDDNLVSIKTTPEFEDNPDKNSSKVQDVVQDYLLSNQQLSLNEDKLKTIENFDSSLQLQPESRKQLFSLLTNKRFMERVRKQLKVKEVEFTELLFEPLNYIEKSTPKINLELEVYHQLADHLIIYIPAHFLRQAKISNPKHLCAIYRKLS